MKSISELYKIRRRLIKKNPLWIIAAILMAAFLGVMYSIAPAYICSSYLITSVFTYFLCAYVSINLHSRENDIFEEVLQLHCVREADYYISRELLQLGICFIFSLILSAFPVLKSVIQPGFFTRPLVLKDFIMGGGMVFACGICGIEMSDLFHPRIMSPKFGICATIFISVLAIVKHSLIQTLPAFTVLNILMPPIMDSFLRLGSTDSFVIADDCLIILHLLIYSTVIALIKIRLLKLKKYRM